VPAYDGTLVAVRTAEETLNVGDMMEANTRIVEEVEEIQQETRDDEPNEENNHADDAGGAVDYTIYHNIIKEMKGE
jgi:hypothetical protein